MCGIAGWAFAAPDDKRLARSLALLSHRGPDGEGRWSDPIASLGHRRLAIIDLSDAGRQPMANEDGTVQVTFNGEAYNFRELRRMLEARHRFTSATDTEVIVHGYEEWGLDELCSRLSGMYAFALWDARTRQLCLVRDRVGKKPLYYAQRAGALYFASTLPALMELLPTTPAIRADAVADYLHYQCVPGDKSLLEGVSKLRPGHVARFDGTTLSSAPYWQLSFAHQEHRSFEDWASQVDLTVRQATSRRLISDVPVGVFLSGGVDSSLVAAAMVEESGGKVTTLSAGFEEQGYDELRWAKMVARHLGTDHHELVVTPSIDQDLVWLAYTQGEPIADPAVLPTFLLSRVAKQSVSVVLTGDGGDEAFAGYPSTLLARFAPAYEVVVPPGLRQSMVPSLLASWGHGSRPLAGVARRARRLAEASRAHFRWRYDMLAEKGFRGRLPAVLHPALASSLTAYDPDRYWDDVFDRADGPTYVDRVLQLELTTQLPDLFLVKADVASMAHGLELRSPLLDAGLLELAARIPGKVKLRRMQPKALLKDLALRRVPRPAIQRRKHGFSLPLDAWFRGPLGALAARLLSRQGLGRRELVDSAQVERLMGEHREGHANHGQRLWALLLLEVWMQLFVDRSLRPRDALS